MADRLADAVRDPQAQDLRLAVEAALGAEQAHDLVDEERVALGRFVDRAHDAVGRAPSGDALDDRGDVALVQTAQRQPLAVADDVAERAGERRVQARLGLAIGPDDEDRRVAQVDRDEAEQEQRRLVGAVQVVEDQHEWAGRRRGPQERRDGIEELKARGVGLARSDVRDGGRAQLGGHEIRDEAREPRGRLGAEPGDGDGDLPLDRQAAQDAQPRPVRRRAAAVPRATPQDERAGLDGFSAELVGEGRLADARVAGDHEQPAAAPQGTAEAMAQLCELALAADEGSPCS